jgi:hypothetical protein
MILAEDEAKNFIRRYIEPNKYREKVKPMTFNQILLQVENVKIVKNLLIIRHTFSMIKIGFLYGRYVDIRFRLKDIYTKAFNEII